MQLKELNEEQLKQLKIKHFTLHLPPTLSQEQLEFIKGVTIKVVRNDPVTLVHEKAIQFLLWLAYKYRNILTEFDEQKRWSEEDNDFLEKLNIAFKPTIDYLIEQYKLDTSKFRRD